MAAISRFVAVAALLLALHAYGFLQYGGWPQSLRGLVYAHVAWLSQVVLVSLILALPLGLLAVLHAPRRLIFSIGASLFAAAHLFVFVDRRIFALYRFHTNGLVLSVLTTPGGSKAFQLGPPEMVGIVTATLLVLALHFILFRQLARVSAPPPRLALGLGAAAVFGVLISDRALYAWADLNNDVELTTIARRLPLYQPFTIKKFAEKHLAMRFDDPLRLRPAASAGALDYPQAPLPQLAVGAQRNVLWIVVDSLRRDALSPETTPSLTRLAGESMRFERHVSAGNNTRNGMFGMFYALPGSYWQPVLAARRPPYLLEAAVALGYEVKPLSSPPLTFPEFRHTIFAGLGAAVEDAMTSSTPAGRDAEMVEHFERFLVRRHDEREDRPFFVTMLFDGSHSPYDYPEGGEIFTPSTRSRYYAARDDLPSQQLIINRYRNAVHTVDAKIARVLAAVRAAGIEQDTVVLVTGDHGEEFYERGFWGHFSAFSPEQIEVPLLLKIPGLPAGRRDDLTSHLDLPATVLALIDPHAAAIPADEYGVGVPLVQVCRGLDAGPGPESRARRGAQGRGQRQVPCRPTLIDAPVATLASGRSHALVCGWDQCALVDERGFLIFGTEPYNATSIDVLSAAYVPIEGAAERRAAISIRAAAIERAIGEMRRFLR